jgi:hypothetical protein
MQIFPRLSKSMLIGKPFIRSTKQPLRLRLLFSVASAMATNYSRAGVVINFVTATGGDVEMLRSIECHYK